MEVCVPKDTLLFSLFITYCIALFVVAHRDDRFLKDFVRFGMQPFSIRRFGAAALVNIFVAVVFILVAVALPETCITP